MVCYQLLCELKLITSNFEFQNLASNFSLLIKNYHARDFKALSYDNIHSSSIIKLNDAHMKRFTQLKEQIIYCFGRVDFALKNVFAIIHTMTNNLIFLRA